MMDRAIASPGADLGARTVDTLERLAFALEAVLASVHVPIAPADGRLATQEALAPSVGLLAREARALATEYRGRTA